MTDLPKNTGGNFTAGSKFTQNRLKTMTLSAEKWHELETHLAAIKDITDAAEVLDPSTISDSDSFAAIIWKAEPYIIKPEVKE
jgi:hypothetical protein